MYSHHVLAFKQPITIIKPGEYLVTEEDIIISTVLGSCVAVALRDTNRAVGGLNHFMLPAAFVSHRSSSDPLPDPRDFLEDSARYGMYAMEILINSMFKLGCRREHLVAKVFGGASVLGFGHDNRKTVAQSNLEFIFEYLETEGIPVLASDVGGSEARKILFFVRNGKVLLKRIKGTYTALVAQEEAIYKERLVAKPVEGEVKFFTDGQT